MNPRREQDVTKVPSKRVQRRRKPWSAGAEICAAKSSQITQNTAFDDKACRVEGLSGQWNYFASGLTQGTRSRCSSNGLKTRHLGSQFAGGSSIERPLLGPGFSVSAMLARQPCVASGGTAPRARIDCRAGQAQYTFCRNGVSGWGSKAVRRGGFAPGLAGAIRVADGVFFLFAGYGWMNRWQFVLGGGQGGLDRFWGSGRVTAFRTV